MGLLPVVGGRRVLSHRGMRYDRLEQLFALRSNDPIVRRRTVVLIRTALREGRAVGDARVMMARLRAGLSDDCVDVADSVLAEYATEPQGSSARAELFEQLDRIAPCQRNLLLVDDDRDLRLTMSAVLVEEGFSVHGASNGREALAAARAQKPALILLDLHMPVMDGWELVDEISQDQELADVPVVIVSSHTRLPRNGRIVGALAKPVDLHRLLRVVGAHCA